MAAKKMGRPMVSFANDTSKESHAFAAGGDEGRGEEGEEGEEYELSRDIDSIEGRRLSAGSGIGS